jgi:hypothetical protein
MKINIKQKRENIFKKLEGIIDICDGVKFDIGYRKIHIQDIKDYWSISEKTKELKFLLEKRIPSFKEVVDYDWLEKHRDENYNYDHQGQIFNLVNEIGKESYRNVELDIRIRKLSSKDWENYKQITKDIYEVKELLGIKDDREICLFGVASHSARNHIRYWKVVDKINEYKKQLKNKGSDRKEIKEKLEKWEKAKVYPYYINKEKVDREVVVELGL